MSISYSTPVFISATHQGQRFWLTGATNERHKSSGNLVLIGQWSLEPSAARSQTLETAVITRRRLWEESKLQVDFSLAAGSLDFVESQAASSPGGPDVERPTMEFRGLLIRPGIDVRSGTKTWFIRLRDPQRGELESIKAESPEEAVQKIFQRGLESLAERAPAPPAPQQSAPARPTVRIRPGSIRR